VLVGGVPTMAEGTLTGDLNGVVLRQNGAPAVKAQLPRG